jgi:hypothetical protein
MGDTDKRNREELTYANATREQIAEAREVARRKLAEADERNTPERQRALRDLLGLDQSAA